MAVEKNPFGSHPFGGAPFGPKPVIAAGPAETITVDKWFQPPSGPTRRKIIVAALAGCVLAPIQPQHNDGIGWHRPLSEPTRRVSERQKQELVSVPFNEFTLVNKWFRPLAEPVRRITTRQQQSVAWQWFNEAFKPDTYHRPFSEPTLRTVYRQHQTVAFDPQPFPAWDWARPLNEPTRRIVAQQKQELAYNPALIEDAGIQAKWFQPFGLPRKAPRAAEYQATFYSPYFVPALSGTGTELNWWPNLSEPVRRKVETAKQDYIGIPFIEDAGLSSKWNVPLSLPTRRKPQAAEGIFAYGTYITPASAEVVTLDKYWRPFADPTRRTTTRWQQDLVSIPFNEVTLVGKWFRPLSEPVLRKVTRQSAGAVLDPFPRVSFSWHAPLSLPVLRKVSRQTAGQSFDPLPRVAFDWRRPLEEPVRRTRLVEGFTAYSNYPVSAETVTQDKWYAALSKPVLRTNPAYSDPFSWGVFTPAPVVVEPGPTCLHVSMQVCYGSASYELKVPDSEMRVKVGSASFKLDAPDSEMRVVSGSIKSKVGDC